MSRSGWVGVDLDGTLAFHDPSAPFDPCIIGPPVPLMVDRVQRHIDAGDDVRIVTARVADDAGDRDTVVVAIMRWCQQHVGRALPVTNAKDYGMVLLYDDRALGVIANCGILHRDQRDHAVQRAAVARDRLIAAHKLLRRIADRGCEFPGIGAGCDCAPCLSAALLASDTSADTSLSKSFVGV